MNLPIIRLLFLCSLLAANAAGCRLEAKNSDKLSALSKGLQYDENGLVITDFQPSLTLNDGATHTKSTSATLKLTVTGAIEMYVTTEAGCANGGSWTTYQESLSVTLSQTNATNTFYAKFRDGQGYESECVSASITHDTVAPTLSVSAPSATSVNTTAATYTVTYSGADSITLSPSLITLNSTGNATGSIGVSGTGSTRTVTVSSITGNGSLGITIAAGSASDAAGNSAAAATPSATFVSYESTQIGAGEQHTCALVHSSVQCWGSANNGRLGNNSTTTHSSTPTPVVGLPTSVSQIGVGGAFACAILSDKTVSCWGANDYGQLGNNATSTTGRATADRVLNSSGAGNLSGATAIAVGATHACAALEDGTLECWGRGSTGQLGDNTNSATRNVPVKVKQSDGVNNLTGVQEITAGSTHTCARLTDKTVCWGLNSSGQLGNNASTNTKLPVNVLDPTGVANLTGITQVAANTNSTCALKTDGSVSCWGSYANGILGNGGTANALLPASVKAPDGVANLSGVSRLTVSGWNSTVCAILTDSELRCWGANDSGQLGINDYSSRDYPVEVKNEAGTGNLTGVLAVSTGRFSTCAILSDKQVRCWGFAGFNNAQMGKDFTNAQAAPVTLKDSTGLSDYVGVENYSSAFYHSCAVANGAASCWGYGTNNIGRLGNNTYNASLYPVPVQGLQSGVAQVEIGDRGSCARKTDETVWCWGANFSGELGNNSATSGHSKVPVQPVGPDGTGALTGVTSLQGGYTHYCGISGGAVYCWGSNASKQLGDNSASSQATLPVAVKSPDGSSTLAGVTKLSSGGDFNCAMNSTAVYCWGLNNYGQLGNNSVVNSGLPVVVSGITPANVSQLATGYYHACVLKTDNTIWCWGRNGLGQLGDNTNTSRSTPVQTQGLAGTPTSVFMPSSNTTCAKVGSGIQCWGYNAAYDLGEGQTSTSYVMLPIWIQGFTTGVSGPLNLGFNYNPCVKMTDGTTKCWGSNTFNKLQIPSGSLLPTLIAPWK